MKPTRVAWRLNWGHVGLFQLKGMSWFLPVCCVNQWTSLKLCKLSVRSVETSSSQQINGFGWHSRDPLWADLFKHAQRSLYVQINLVGVLRFVSEIAGKHRSICCVFAAQAPRCSMSYLAKLSWQSSQTLVFIHPQQHCILIKDSFKFKARPKTTGDTLSPTVAPQFGPCSFHTNTEKCVANLLDGALPYNKGTEGWCWKSYMPKWASHLVFTLFLCTVNRFQVTSCNCFVIIFGASRKCYLSQ